MAFWGTRFSFNGVSSDTYDLYIYNIENAKNESGYALNGSISEDKMKRKMKPVFYGIDSPQPTTMRVVFGSDKHLSRPEIESIYGWLIRKDGYHNLTVYQDDMPGVSYNCIFLRIDQVELFGFPVAFQAEVRCDSAFGHLTETSLYANNIGGSGSKQITFWNRSNIDTYYYPTCEINITAGSTFSLENMTTGENFIIDFHGNNNTDITIIVNGDAQTVTSASESNLYKYINLTDVNFSFPRFASGANQCLLSEGCSILFKSSFPVMIGS